MDIRQPIATSELCASQALELNTLLRLPGWPNRLWPKNETMEFKMAAWLASSELIPPTPPLPSPPSMHKNLVVAVAGWKLPDNTSAG